MNLNNCNYPLSQETSLIIGMAMAVHRTLGRGLSEIVYKVALEYEFAQKDIEYT